MVLVQQVALDCELGCPSMSPPTPDLYILDAIDPATAYYNRLKAALILHMVEVKLQPTDLQDSLGQLMRPIALHVREEDINLRWAGMGVLPVTLTVTLPPTPNPQPQPQRHLRPHPT